MEPTSTERLVMGFAAMGLLACSASTSEGDAPQTARLKYPPENDGRPMAVPAQDVVITTWRTGATTA